MDLNNYGFFKRNFSRILRVARGLYIFIRMLSAKPINPVSMVEIPGGWLVTDPCVMVVGYRNLALIHQILVYTWSSSVCSDMANKERMPKSFWLLPVLMAVYAGTCRMKDNMSGLSAASMDIRYAVCGFCMVLFIVIIVRAVIEEG